MSKTTRFILLLPIRLSFPILILIAAVFSVKGWYIPEYILFVSLIVYNISVGVVVSLADSKDNDKEDNAMTISRTFFFPNTDDGDKELEKFVKRTGCRVKQIKESAATTMLIADIDEEKLSEESFRRALLRDVETLKSFQKMIDFPVDKKIVKSIEEDIRKSVEKLDKYREVENE